jgi:hypothetical protein
VVSDDRQLAAALAQLRRNPRSTHARAQAVSALGALARDITALRQLFLHASPAAAKSHQGKQVLSALSTLSQILRAERRAMATHGAGGLAAAFRVARRNASRERHALSVLATAS